MKNFFKQTAVFLFLLASFFASNQVALAADGYGLNTTGGAVGYDTSGTSNTVPSLVNKIISGALVVLMFVFFGLTLYAGIRWMLARGNDEFIQQAKDTLTAAIIGLVIVSLSYALTKFVFSRLGQ